MATWDEARESAMFYKVMFPPGTRVVLECMGDDPRPIEPGTRGKVRVVDDMGTVHCDFDNGRRLGLIPGEDSFRALSKRELSEEYQNFNLAGRLADATERCADTEKTAQDKNDLYEFGKER